VGHALVPTAAQLAWPAAWTVDLLPGCQLFFCFCIALSNRTCSFQNELTKRFHSKYRDTDNYETLMGGQMPLGKAFRILAVCFLGPSLPTEKCRHVDRLLVWKNEGEASRVWKGACSTLWMMFSGHSYFQAKKQSQIIHQENHVTNEETSQANHG
jgi:hypothetical protein